MLSADGGNFAPEHRNIYYSPSYQITHPLHYSKLS